MPARVLIVEDEFLIRMTVAEALRDEGFEVAEAASGDEALPLIEAAEPIALLLTDLQLPGSLGGVALAMAARQLRPELLIIYTTGRPDALPEAPLSARDAVMAKPYLPSQLCDIVRQMVDATSR